MFWTGGRRSLRQDVATFLEELGTTSAEIAARLAEEGIRGVPGSTDSCAIAVYLHAVLGADGRVRDIHVSQGWVTVDRYWAPGFLTPHSDAVRAFIRMFDAGSFPVLVRAKPAACSSETIPGVPGQQGGEVGAPGVGLEARALQALGQEASHD